jgi:hypothetical protein
MKVAPEKIIDLIGELGREVHYMLDDCETSGPVGEEVHTITTEGLTKVGDLLDQIEALPFEEPGFILGPGAMLQAAIKQTFLPARQTKAQGDVLRERERQFYGEGWTDTHDDTHVNGELADAALAYLSVVVLTRDLVRRGLIIADTSIHETMEPPQIWPWASSWWKPKDERRDLVRAAALIIAEIERLDRAEAGRA